MSDAEEKVTSKDTEAVILEATFRAISKHGYATSDCGISVRRWR
jgi:hypothetical protein